VDVAMERGGTTWVQLSRGAAAELDLVPGDAVGISRAGPSGRGRGCLSEAELTPTGSGRDAR